MAFCLAFGHVPSMSPDQNHGMFCFYITNGLKMRISSGYILFVSFPEAILHCKIGIDSWGSSSFDQPPKNLNKLLEKS
jgi:hypothetical protein